MNHKISLMYFIVMIYTIDINCADISNRTDNNVINSTTTIFFSEGENIPAIANTPNTLTQSANSTNINLSTESKPANTIKHNTIYARKGVENEKLNTTLESINKTINTNTTEIKSTTEKVTPSSSTTTTTTTTQVPRIIPHKPTVTIGADEPYAPSHFLNKKNQIKEPIPSKVSLNDTIDNKNIKQHLTKIDEGPDYIVPIVITILSVPLFIALMMLAYRHGADWWDRRHYRRMDYLIEGIYNN